jgi:5'-3' exonuclease
MEEIEKKEVKKQVVLLIDLANMFWFCRGKHTEKSSLEGGWPMVQQWLYIFNNWIKIHKPTTVFFLGDGYPHWRYNKFADYKGNRQEGRDKDILLKDFIRQKADIKKIIQGIMPAYYLYHEALEADDLFYISCRYLNEKCDSENMEIIGMSTDDDWRQMMVKYENVKIWHPIKKVFKEKPDFDFVRYKALKGDVSDNIPGFPKIGEKTVMKMLKDENLFNNWLSSLNEFYKERYENNLFLVDSTNVSEDYVKIMYEYIDLFKRPQFLSSFLRIYCVEKKLFRFLKNFEEKVLNFKSLQHIVYKDNLKINGE